MLHRVRWKVNRRLVGKEKLPPEVETTKSFESSSWSAPPSVHTTLSVALLSTMHFGQNNSVGKNLNEAGNDKSPK